jgi:hypothetical protein
MTVSCAAIVGPWLYRNERATGQFAFSDPSYLAASLSHRAGYNAMSWRDWGIAWIDYLPDFGDKMAAALFGEAPVERLGWETGSYYAYGRDVLHPMVQKEAAPGTGTSILLRDHILGQPLKHAAVTAVLTWRGLFIGHYWGLAGLLALIAFLAVSGRAWEMGVVAVPAYAVAAFNAAISVSITRYNLQLLVPGAIALGWLVAVAATRFSAGRRRAPARASTNARSAGGT